MIAIDFFCGAGGLTRGLLNAGIRVSSGIDSDSRLRETYESNNRPAFFVHADLRNISTQDLNHLVDGIAPDDLILAACAPCQAFTKQRRAKKPRPDRTLLGRFADFVAEWLPECVLVENVPGLPHVPGLSTYRRFRRLLSELGYRTCEEVLDAKDYGVPQTRRRFVLIAGRSFVPSFPPPTHGPVRQPYCTVKDAIAAYPPIAAGQTHPAVPNHRASALSPLNLRRIRSTPQDGGDRRHWPPDLILECHKNGHSGHTDVYGRMWWHRPAPALTCRCDSLSNGRYGHPEQDRAVSLREAARLQSFDDSYTFCGPSKAHIAAQIGNAVPVKLAEAIASHILMTARHRRRP